jgi:membrane fusion protein, epimerase transport system
MNQDTRAPSLAEAAEERSASADDRRFRWIGMLIVLIVFGGFGTWAMLAPLSSAASAPGIIAVESYRKTVQHLEGGIVKTIHVRDGEAVKKDQVLITLDDTQSRAQLEVMRGQHFIVQAREARLSAQRDGLAQVNYPRELLQNQTDERVKEAMRVQNQTFRARKTAHEGEISVYEQQIGQLKAKADGLRAQRASREQLVSSFRGELDDFQALLKEGYTEKQKVRELERNWANSSGQLGELTSSLAAIDLQVSETQLKILQLQKELQREVAKELSEVQAQLFELKEKMQSLQDTVERMVVRATQAGTVLDLQVHTLGAVARPGAKLLDIVPQGERLVVEAKVSPIDIDRVRIGQIADIRFTAFKTRDTPKVDGKVIALSADVLVDEADARKMSYYLARVDITPQGLRDLTRQKLDLVAGMPAEVLINTGERTLFNYLIDPLKNTVARSLTED